LQIRALGMLVSAAFSRPREKRLCDALLFAPTTLGYEARFAGRLLKEGMTNQWVRQALEIILKIFASAR
jgi:hypothetical protein